MLIRLLYWSAVGGGALSLLSFLAGGFWLLDLFSHFRVQYVVLLALAGALLLAFRRRQESGIVFSFAIFNALLVLPLFQGPETIAGEWSAPLRAMSINLLTSNRDHDAVLGAVAQEDPDVLSLLELDSIWLERLEAELQDTYPHRLSAPQPDNFGLALFSRIPFADAQLRELDAGQLVVDASFGLEDGRPPFRIIAAHLRPPMGRGATALRDLGMQELGAMAEESGGPCLILGDLNATPWSMAFRRLLGGGKLMDSSRGFGFQPTWPTRSPLLSIPIDHALYTRGIHIRDRRIGPEVGSDHRPLVVEFALATTR